MRIELNRFIDRSLKRFRKEALHKKTKNKRCKTEFAFNNKIRFVNMYLY